MGGLPEKHVHSGVIAVFDIAFLGKCSKCDDGSGISHLTDESGTLKTIQIWHLWSISGCFWDLHRVAYLNVHEYQIKEFTFRHAFLDFIICFLTILRNHDIVDVF